MELIGKGGFATIYKAISESDRLIVALKVINKRKILAERNMAVRRIKQKLIRSEAEIMSKCESKHVVRLYGRYETDDYIMLALEYCNGGDLAMQIDNRGKIPENEAVLIIKQIVLGFAVKKSIDTGFASAQCCSSRPEVNKYLPSQRELQDRRFGFRSHH